MNAQNVRPVTSCRVCGGSDWQDVVDLGEVPLANAFLEPAASYEDEPAYPLGVISCRSCRLMSVTHVVDPEVMYRTYSYVTSDSETITRHMEFVATTCRERAGFAAGDLVVELGSNTGQQLEAFARQGCRVLGVDPARNLAAVADARGIPTLPEFFTEATASAVRRSHGPARLVLGRHVFAHIDDLAGVLAGVRALLAPDGVFAVEVPYAVDLLEKYAFDTIYHEHLSYFLVRTLDTLFTRHGLSLFDVERLPVHGGSLLVLVGRTEARRPVTDAVGALRAAEERAGLGSDAAYREFARGVRNVREELPALVRSLIAEGERIAGYGASAKGTTILNVCGLGADEVAYCTDTTTLKQGKVLPGTHIPVRSPGDARSDPPDVYLMLAWNYADEILRKEADFLRAGGRFVLPFPKPAVVSADTLR
ncbi:MULTISPECIES: class I SAM-dependent methyltransferase [unclassified Streptomyces]|uniref:class I SAM-dependent methyltransferase n=1 Tax=unclassified Streptomyces TaxID=2593676 RepID=UPI0006F73B02|nr:MULTISPECIES: class I SAM-dependent methyltransferase [unclassified Streptomyces]KQX56322.1 SAM-dependent methyltransferase [Streptomyces sp. Root1304]KRA97137.1 SAM-dependent methyltransferase [Streptomyces sp. Root66D1]